ncbi:MAG: nucleotide exchange factor GrpE [Chloroflexi bacterium]|nr:nucleotide exchange factor GrpE [Chloroflexota bacterium]
MNEQHKKHPVKNQPIEKRGEDPSEKTSSKIPVEDILFSQPVAIEDVEILISELEKTKKEAATNLDGWQRERAEFANYKKRIDRDQAQLHQLVTGAVIKKYLVILDDLDLALKNKPLNGDGAVWAEGIELIVRKLQSVIDGEGIERINQNTIPFDPNLHEAISNEENPEFESGMIIEVVRQGYKLGDRILRPAMVRVAR